MKFRDNESRGLYLVGGLDMIRPPQVLALFFGAAIAAALFACANAGRNIPKQRDAITLSVPSATPMAASTVSNFSLFEFRLPKDMAGPHSIVAVGSSGAWFTEIRATGNAIGFVSRNGSLHQYLVPTPNSAPSGITTDSQGSVWFSESAANKIGHLTRLHQFVEYRLPSKSAYGSTPTGIVTAPDKTLWFTESNIGAIGQLAPRTGVIKEISLVIRGGAEHLAIGTDGIIWITQPGANVITKVVPPNQTNFNVPTSSSSLAGIAVDQSGTVWFAEFSANKIGHLSHSGNLNEYHLPSSGSGPSEVAIGPDGTVWFTEYRGDRIGRITNRGSIEERPLSPGSRPLGIAVAQDGTVWFTEYNSNRIGMLSPRTLNSSRAYTVRSLAKANR